ncbi:MAG: PilT/PilU family type 4a pilus ATPase [Planctomycetes bacterium]|nr:PilT/PilU family type 4a pilus ATPase [Planctomycetota bacterium]
MDAEAFALLKIAVEKGASDLHLASGSAPFMRLNGALTFMKDENDRLSPQRALRMVLGFMDDEQQQRYLRHHDLDFSYEHPELGRSRVNALEQFRGPDIIFRIIPRRVPTLKELGLPESLAKFTEWHQGLVLVTGPAGCGKSTTAAALINLVNQGRKDHIITVEDPVEFIHKSAGCNVTQRQVPNHTASFAAALKGALREDPDVIMIGEMRDLETVALAIRAAETGHLVIGTLQTKSAARTIDRVVDVFPSDQQAQIRTMLSESLRGIISQQLIPRADGKGRVASLEVLHVNTAVSNLIRDSKTFQLPSLMQTGRKIGQRLMDDSLQDLIESNTITKEEARKAAENPKRFL